MSFIIQQAQRLQFCKVPTQSTLAQSVETLRITGTSPVNRIWKLKAKPRRDKNVTLWKHQRCFSFKKTTNTGYPLYRSRYCTCGKKKKQTLILFYWMLLCPTQHWKTIILFLKKIFQQVQQHIPRIRQQVLSNLVLPSLIPPNYSHERLPGQLTEKLSQSSH